MKLKGKIDVYYSIYTVMAEQNMRKYYFEKKSMMWKIDRYNVYVWDICLCIRYTNM